MHKVPIPPGPFRLWREWRQTSAVEALAVTSAVLQVPQARAAVRHRAASAVARRWFCLHHGQLALVLFARSTVMGTSAPQLVLLTAIPDRPPSRSFLYGVEP